MKKLTLIIFLFLQVTLLSSQLNPWFIGGKIWEWPNSWTDMPEASYPEGYDILYDINGDVLLYINNNHLIGIDGIETPNTLNASIGGPLIIDESSTQSVLFVPHPGNSNIYYLFSTPADMSGNTYYSKIDLSLNSGIGDVVLAEKNVMLFEGGTEKIAATYHPTINGIWVLFHETGNNIFRSYLIDENGLNVNSYQTTSIGSVVDTSSVADARGEMIFSFSGTQVACAIESGSVEIFDFNKQTGLLYCPRILNDSNLYAPYGVAFSPMEDFLYTSDLYTGAVLQFNISLPDTLIVSSKVILNPPVNPVANQPLSGCLEIHLEGKIYQARYLKNRLGVIHYPDSSGISCDYDTNFVIGSNIANAGTSELGLPNSIPHFFSFDIWIDGEPLDPCQSGLIKLVKPQEPLADSIVWYLDYPNMDTAFIRVTYSDTLIFEYPEPGYYDVVAENRYNSNVFEDWGPIYVSMRPPLDLGHDTTLCKGESLSFDLSYYDTCYWTIPDYHWQYELTSGTFQNSSSILTVDQEGIYYIEISTPAYYNCLISDSIIVTYSADTLNLGLDTIMPQISNFTISSPIGYNSYLWSTSETSNSINIESPGTYWLEVINQDGCIEQDTILIGLLDPLTITSTVDSLLCNGDCNAIVSLNISGGITPYSIIWSTGDISSSIDSLCSGDYYVTITGSNSVPVCPWTIQSPLISNQSIFPEINLQSIGSTCIGDTLAAFVYDTSGVAICVGLKGITNSNGNIAQMFFYQDNPATPVKDGCVSGDIINFKLYRYGDGSIVDINSFDVLWSIDMCFPTYYNIGGGSFVRINDYPSPTTLSAMQMIQKFEINDPISLTLSQSHSSISCNGDESNVSFNVSGGTPPYVYPADTTLPAGNYILVAIDNLGCIDTLDFTLNQPDELILVPSYSPIVCYGGETFVNFSSVGGIPPYTMPSDSNFVAGTYQFISIDSLSCTDTLTITIDEPSLIEIDTLITPASSSSSNDGAINLTVYGGIAPYSFNWSNGSNTEDINNLATGIYSIELIDSLGCIKTDSFNVPFLQFVPQIGFTDIIIYPNPTTSLLYIERISPQDQISLFSIDGKLLYHYETNKNDLSINLSEFAMGFYLLSIKRNNEFYYRKIVKE